jgi:alpha-1,6-mannosyltransferase
MIVSKMILEHHSFKKTILICSTFVFISLFCTIGMDSFYWNRWVWPEFQVFLFNGIENRSVEWGTSPFYDYITHLLPRIIPLSFPMACISLRYAFARPFVGLSMVHVFFLSLVPHKEWRFVMYCIPMMNIAASIGIAKIQSKKQYLLLIMTSIGLFFISMLMLMISSFNYPGGVALQRFQAPNSSCYVHVDTYTAMTGASRFGQVHPHCVYSKKEHVSSIELQPFDYILTHDPRPFFDFFHIVEQIEGYNGISIQVREFVREMVRFRVVGLIKIKWEPLVYIMKKSVPIDSHQ